MNLLEILLAILLIGFLVAMPIWRFRAGRSYKLRMAATALTDDIERLIVAARLGGGESELKCTGNTAIISLPNGTITRAFVSPITLESCQLSFYPTGVVSPATVTLKDGAASCQIKIGLRGAVQRC